MIGIVLWTYKSKFELFDSQRRTYVIRRKIEKMLEECLTPSVKHGGGNVMVWGCFGGCKVGDLYRVKGILKKEGHHSILQRHTIPCGRRLIGANFLLPPTSSLFREEAVSWYSVYNGVASIVTGSQPC